MQAVRHRLDDAERDVGGIEIREDQQVGFARKRAVGHDALAQNLGDGRITMHFAIDFEVRREFAHELQCLTHLGGALGIA
ncbi:hypothetical protein D9M72_647110 [compost metagenome]